MVDKKESVVKLFDESDVLWEKRSSHHTGGPMVRVSYTGNAQYESAYVSVNRQAVEMICGTSPTVHVVFGAVVKDGRKMLCLRVCDAEETNARCLNREAGKTCSYFCRWVKDQFNMKIGQVLTGKLQTVHREMFVAEMTVQKEVKAETE